MGDTNLNIEIGPSPQAARGLLEAAELPSVDLGDEQIKTVLLLWICGCAGCARGPGNLRRLWHC